MSDLPFQLPISQGTGEPFSQVIRQPPKFTIRGVAPDTPEGRAAIEKWQGAIRQFYQQQRQDDALSTLNFYQTEADLANGVRVTYVRNFSQETVILEITPHPAPLAPGLTSPDEYWQWAIIETVIPNIQGLTYASMSAFMTPPPNNGKLGVALDGTEPQDPDRPPLSYPIDDLGTFIADIQDNDQVSSLRVDLRPYPGGVKFDLYGFIHKYQDGTKMGDPTSAAYRLAHVANAVTPSGTEGGGAGPWPTTGDVTGHTLGDYEYKDTTVDDILYDFPSLSGETFVSTTVLPSDSAFGLQGASYMGESVTWGSGTMPTDLNASALISAAGGIISETTTMGADGFTKIVRGVGAMDYYFDAGLGQSVALNGAGPTQSQGNYGINFYDYTMYWVGSHPQVPNYVYPTRDCPISFAVMDVGPDALTNHYGSPLKGNSYRWESTKKYPSRWPMKQLNTIAMQSIDDPLVTTIANHYGMIKLGTVIINPKKGKGGIKFTPA